MNKTNLPLSAKKFTPNFNYSGIETTRHRIYNRLLEFLENKQRREIKPKRVLHRETRRALLEKCKIPTETINRLENSILRESANISFEITRDSPAALFHELKRSGDENLIIESRIVCVPNFILNACVCEALEKEFARSEILTVEGFILREGYIRLDVDEKISARGFMMPVFRNGRISAMKVFRYPKDTRPFILRSRKTEVSN